MERVESTESKFHCHTQSGEHTGFINVHLGFRGQHSVVPHPLGRRAIAVAALPIYCLVPYPERGAGYGGSEVHEFFHYFQSVVVYLNAGGTADVLS